MAHILIAIDSADDVLDSLRTQLATAGHLAVTTRDGVEAWGLLSTGLFDCAVLDTRAQGPNGERLLDRIRRTPETAHLAVALLAQHEHERMTLLGRVDEEAQVILAYPLTTSDVLDALQLHFGVSAGPSARQSPIPMKTAGSDADAPSTLP